MPRRCVCFYHLCHRHHVSKNSVDPDRGHISVRPLTGQPSSMCSNLRTIFYTTETTASLRQYQRHGADCCSPFLKQIDAVLFTIDIALRETMEQKVAEGYVVNKKVVLLENDG
ncbi:hypothetical protein TNIN_59631 [Trichonephila inaurata madagascariensis]|uniref:Uncharacterized protein n=1 Tax=Trichonephila inaurata madagascariensis TaxID=2747483 RepID=A0A8X6K4Z9_9ARAC|nr:hypothetical protein TNIN_59631 [Trichonephila inaurata madagascariensis]